MVHFIYSTDGFRIYTLVVTFSTVSISSCRQIWSAALAHGHISYTSLTEESYCVLYSKHLPITIDICDFARDKLRWP